MSRPGAGAGLGHVPPTHLAGVVVLIIAVFLHTLCMWSPEWSKWTGSLNWDTSTSTDSVVHYNGPWLRSCFGDNGIYDYDEPLYHASSTCCNKGTPCNGYASTWTFGTQRCNKYVFVAEGDCTHTRLGVNNEEITEGWNKCNRLIAVRVCTFTAMVLGFLALFLSILAIAMPHKGSNACLGCCLATLIAGFLIFVAVCIWADINRWERNIMREQCRDAHEHKSSRSHTFKCWDEDGSTLNDDWEDIDPPYGLSWAWGLEIPTMLMIPAGGMLVALGGYKK